MNPNPTLPPRPTWCAFLALAFLLTQLVFVVRSRFVTDRFFSWGPHDRQVEYHVDGQLPDGTPITEYVGQRYGIEVHGWGSHAAEDFIWTIATRENRMPPEKRASVSLTYRVNGGPWHTWRYR